MDFKKAIPLFALLLLILFIIGSSSAASTDFSSSPADNENLEIDSFDSNEDLTVNTNTNYIESGNNLEIDYKSNSKESVNATNDIKEETVDYNEDISVEKNNLKSSKLSSVYKITESNYSNYFNKSGNILSNVNSGDTLDFSGSFNNKDFKIDIPLTVTSSDGAQFIDCSFKFNKGSDGSNISNLNINSSRLQSPLIYLDSVSNMNVFNNNLFSCASKSYALCFSNVSYSSAYHNTLQTTAFVVGWGHPSAFVLAGANNLNISSNNVIVNDSNGIYFTTYVGDTISANLINENNYIFNNTVHSVRGVEWAVDENGTTPLPSSFCYAIQVMGSGNKLLNNTVYNAYRGISASGSNSIVAGNVVYDIKGNYYSGNTKDDGGDYGINVGPNSIVENNTIYNSHFNKNSGVAISVGSNTTVRYNNITNINGTGADLSKNFIEFSHNRIDNVSDNGIRVKGQYGNTNISDNFINSTDSSITLLRSSKDKYPSRINIENNDFYTDVSPIYYLEGYIGKLTAKDNTLNGSSISDISIDVPSSSETKVSINSTKIDFNESVLIMPTVSAYGLSLEGLVDIIVNSQKIATVPIGSNYTFTPTEAGSFSINANFTGNEEYKPSESAVLILTVTPKETTTSIIISPSTVELNDTVVISPFVRYNGTLLEGFVDILLDGEKLDTVEIGSDYSYVPNSSGSFYISASFSGGNGYGASVSDMLILTVNESSSIEDPDDPTNLTVSSILISPNTVEVNDTVLISPFVRCNGTLLEGLVDILIDGEKLDSVVIGSDYAYVPSTAGTFNISASYAGGNGYEPSVSDIVVLTVNEKQIIDNGTDNNGTDNNGTDTNGTGTNGTDTNGTDNNGTDTNGTDTNGTENNGTDTNQTKIIINDDNYSDYFDDGYPIDLDVDGNYTLIFDSLNNKDIIIPSGFNINIIGKEGSGTINNGTIQIGDGSDEVGDVNISTLTFNNYNKDAIVINEIAYDVTVENNKIIINTEATPGNLYFSVYGVNAKGYIDLLTVRDNDIFLNGSAPYLYGVSLGGYGAIANPQNIFVQNNTININSTANMGMAEGIYLDNPINAAVLDNKINIESINDVYVYGMQIADSAFSAIGEGKTSVKSPYNIMIESNDLNLKSKYMVYGITVLDYGCDGSLNELGQPMTNMMDLDTTIQNNNLIAVSDKAVMGIVGKTYNMSVLWNNLSVIGGSIEGVASHDALGVDNYALGVQYSGKDYTVLVKDNTVSTNVLAEYLNNKDYEAYVSFVNNTIYHIDGPSSGNDTPENGTGDNGTNTNGTDINGTDTNGTDNNGTNNGTNGTNDTDTNNTDNITKRTAKDLQELIDNATSGSVVDLGDFEYIDVSDINISKDISIVGNNTVIRTAGDGKPVFNIKEGLSSVSISGIEFMANNGDVLVRAKAVNSTSRLAIETPEINIINNTVIKSDDGVVAESVTVLELDSSRCILAPTNDIKVSNNTLEMGMDPFNFVVESVINSADVNVPVGGDLQSKVKSVIHYEDMDTVAVAKADGRVGKYFEVNLTDSDGNPLSGKFVQIGFNGAVYNRTTNETGGVRLQINLGYKGTYTFAISYLGDENYNGSFVVAKIKVSTQNTKITSSSKTYKASAKTKTLTATLKSSVNGNPISGKKLTFTVNGKSYTATTNSKGVASVKVSLSSKKTYSFTVKYAGDDTYSSSSASGKLTIK